MDTMVDNQYSMCKTLVVVCDDNASIIASIPVIASDYALFKSKVGEIDPAVQQQITEIKGITRDTHAMKSSLTKQADIFASAIMSLADSTSNSNLKLKVKYSRSRMHQMRPDFLVPLCRVILKEARKNSAVLVNYGINAAMLTDFETLTGDYFVKSAATRAALSSRKVYTRKIKVLLSEALSLLRNRLDKDMKVLQDIEPEFYELYCNSRIIVDTHGKSRKNGADQDVEPSAVLSGTVTNSATGEPVENASVELVEKGLANRTDEDGEYYFENVPEGIHTLRVSSDGYDVYVESNVALAANDELLKDVSLTPLPEIDATKQ